jgi:hypothetical protein
MKSVKEIFNEFKEEARKGTVTIGDAEYNIRFNTVIGEDSIDDNYKNLIIKDMDLFQIKLSEYIDLGLDKTKELNEIENDDYKVKILLASLIANAEDKDYEDPISYLDEKIANLKNISLEEGKVK